MSTSSSDSDSSSSPKEEEGTDDLSLLTDDEVMEPEIEAPNRPAWHPLHNDPTLDVVIRAIDGVHLRASSHVRERESSLFNGMLSTIPNPHMSSTDAIPLEHVSSTISAFLDASTSHHPLDYRSFSFEALHRQMTLTLKLDCDRLIVQVRTAYTWACDQDPVKWFIATSDDDDVDQAKDALLRCAAIRKSLDTALVFELSWKIRKDWRHPFLKAIMQGDSQQNVKPKDPCLLRITWPNEVRVEQFKVDVGRSRAEDADSSDSSDDSDDEEEEG